MWSDDDKKKKKGKKGKKNQPAVEEQTEDAEGDTGKSRFMIFCNFRF